MIHTPTFVQRPWELSSIFDRLKLLGNVKHQEDQRGDAQHLSYKEPCAKLQLFDIHVISTVPHGIQIWGLFQIIIAGVEALLLGIKAPKTPFSYTLTLPCEAIFSLYFWPQIQELQAFTLSLPKSHLSIRIGPKSLIMRQGPSEARVFSQSSCTVFTTFFLLTQQPILLVFWSN